MPLLLFNGIRPVQVVESVEQAGAVGGDAQHPLPHHSGLDWVPPTLRNTVFDFVISQYRAQGRAPIHSGFGQIGQSVVHELFRTFRFVEPIPVFCTKSRCIVGASRTKLCGAVYFEMPDQVMNRACPTNTVLRITIKPAVEELQKDPLRPAVVGRLAGGHSPRPIIREAHFSELFCISLDVLFRCLGRVLTRLYGILLGRKTEGVESHGVENGIATHSMIACHDVAGYIAQWMTYMQSSTRRIGKHVQHIIGRAFWVVGCMMDAFFFPKGLPSLFFLSKMILTHGCINCWRKNRGMNPPFFVCFYEF